MKSQVEKLLTDLEQALLLASVSMWMWEETSGNFTPLPLRVSTAITALQKVCFPKTCLKANEFKIRKVVF